MRSNRRKRNRPGTMFNKGHWLAGKSEARLSFDECVISKRHSDALVWT